ncbi:MAG: hypothetical protein AAB855_02190 [Patescibacteria group bacterium]
MGVVVIAWATSDPSMFRLISHGDPVPERWSPPREERDIYGFGPIQSESEEDDRP